MNFIIYNKMNDKYLTFSLDKEQLKWNYIHFINIFLELENIIKCYTTPMKNL